MRIVLLLLALIVSASGARAAIHRDALWFVLRSCVVAQNTAGIPFPCLAVNLASSTGPGYAVLRAPFNPRGVLVVPVEKIWASRARSCSTPMHALTGRPLWSPAALWPTRSGAGSD